MTRIEFYQGPKPLNMDVKRACRHFHKGFKSASIPLTSPFPDIAFLDEKDPSLMIATFIFSDEKESEQIFVIECPSITSKFDRS